MQMQSEFWRHSSPLDANISRELSTFQPLQKTLQIIGYKLICDFTICFASPGCDFTICFASAGSMNRAFRMGKKTNNLCATEFPAIPARFYRFESRSRSWVFFSPKIELKFTSSRCPLCIVHCSFVPLYCFCYIGNSTPVYLVMNCISLQERLC